MNARDLIIVSNRLPVRLERREERWLCEPASGGLVSALSGVREELEFRWIGWPGANVPAEEQAGVRELLRSSVNYEPVFLTDTEIDRFYNGFCNSVLWPLFHYLPGRVDFNLPYWDDYRAVNERFAAAAADAAPKHALVWVHDYHLFLLPRLLRQRRPDVKIGFFLHIPFPASEIYRLLPVRNEILRGVLGSDLIAFHTHDYSRYFAQSCLRVLGAEWGPTEIRWEGRRIAVGAYPIGIHWQRFADTLRTEEGERQRRLLASTYGDVKLILGVDRNDYAKGLTQKLAAYERFLDEHPQWRGKVVLLQVLVPSRMGVRDYRALKSEIDRLVGRINGRFGDARFNPIRYVAQEIDFAELCALYERADVLLTTSIRDGMNLVSLEYAACQRERHGVIVLSEFAGVARSLGGALLVNPWDARGTAEAIHRALTLEGPERARRALENFTYVRDFHSLGWARRFLRDLESGLATAANPPQDLQSEFLALKKEYLRADDRLLLLDYDGTLVPFAPTPDTAAPESNVTDILKSLAEKPDTRLWVISGRDRADLERWFGDLPIGLAAEHGLAIRRPGGREWVARKRISTEWMEPIEKVLRDHVRRTPGSRLERKSSSLAWHYREADEKFGEWQALELAIHLEETLSNQPVTVLRGNKVVEIRPQEIDKGALVREILAENPSSGRFILSIGDDRTDEDMFASLPPPAWTCRVGGQAATAARFFLETPAEVLDLLQELGRIG